VCIALCTIVAHNIAQNRPDSFPPYPPVKRTLRPKVIKMGEDMLHTNTANRAKFHRCARKALPKFVAPN